MKKSMTTLRASVLALLAVTAFSSPGAPGGNSGTDADPAAQQRSYAELEAKASQQGTVRVLVQMQLPSGAAQASQSVQVQSQRQQIKSTREDLLRDVRVSHPQSLKSFRDIPFVAMEVDASTLAQLKTDSRVVSISADRQRNALLQDSVPLIGGRAAWAAGFSGSGQAVAVLDTGVDGTHPFLAGKLVAEACYSTTSTTEGTTTLCPNGQQQQIGSGAATPCGPECRHGTHVAGIAAGQEGVAKDASIIGVQVFSSRGSGIQCVFSSCTTAFDSDILKGLEYVYSLRNTHRIAAVNLSLGSNEEYASYCDNSPEGSPAFKAIFAKLISAGIAPVVAAGNGGNPNGLSFPACLSNAVSVGATTKSDVVASYSNLAPYLSLMAPGDEIYSSIPGGGFEFLSGTSMAAPHVAGAWAVMRSQQPAASVQQVLTRLQSTGKSITDFFGQAAVSAKRIQLDAALGIAPQVPNDPPTQAPLTPIAPAGTISNATPSFRWVRSSGGSMYTLSVFSANGWYAGIRIISDAEAGCATPDSVCSATLNGPLSTGSYSWSVESIERSFTYLDGPTQTFTVTR